MKNYTRAFTGVLVLVFLSGIASVKRVEAHIIDKRDTQPKFWAKGHTIILLKGSSNADLGK